MNGDSVTRALLPTSHGAALAVHLETEYRSLLQTHTSYLLLKASCGFVACSVIAYGTEELESESCDTLKATSHCSKFPADHPPRLSIPKTLLASRRAHVVRDLYQSCVCVVVD
jgi:hypothetical protein